MGKLSLQSLILRFLDFLREAISADRIVLYVSESNQTFVCNGNSSALSKDREGFLESLIKQAMKLKRPLLFPSSKACVSFQIKDNPVKDVPPRVLCLPLVGWERILGAVYLERNAVQIPFTDADLDALSEWTRPLYRILKKETSRNLEEADRNFSSGLLIGTSESHKRVLQLIDRVKDNDAPVFIWGKSGTGKELVARTIHETGHRKGRFVVVNCGAIPHNLLESEFFGHVRGAFTGALRDRAGLVDEADGGTFFLDEVADLSLSLQPKLLRLLQEKEFRRVGDNRLRKVDVRFISATNRNLEKEVARGCFREDLYYRLKIITIEIPPLKERAEDILCLVNYFLEYYCKKMKRARAYFSPRCLEFLMNYAWPGNVREVQNEIQRCLILSGGQELITEEYLSKRISPERLNHSQVKSNYFHARAEFEKRFLCQALIKFRYNRARTAEEIGISRQGLFKLIKKHSIAVPFNQEENDPLEGEIFYPRVHDAGGRREDCE